MISIYHEDNLNLLLNLRIKDANMGNADEFKASLLELFNTHQNKKLILSMADVEYIDSSFLGALVAVLKHTITHKSDLVLVALRKDVSNLFALIRLDKVFKIYIDFDEAFAQ